MAYKQLFLVWNYCPKLRKKEKGKHRSVTIRHTEVVPLELIKIQNVFANILYYHKAFSAAGAGDGTSMLRAANLNRVCRNHKSEFADPRILSPGVKKFCSKTETRSCQADLPLCPLLPKLYSNLHTPHIPRGTNMPKISNPDPALSRSHPRRSPE